MQMPVPMMNVINGGAHANNTLDFQEFMIAAGRRAVVPRGAALRRGGFPGAEEDHRLERHVHRGRRRGRLRAQPADARRGDRADPRGHRPAPATPPAQDVVLGARLRGFRVLNATASTCSSRRRRRSARAQFADYLAELASRYPIVSIEDGMARGRLGRLEAPDREARQQAAARRRRPLRHQPAHPAAKASASAWPTRS